MSTKWVRNRATGSYSSEDTRWVIHKTLKGWELEDLKSKSKYVCNTLKESQQKCEELIKYYKNYSKTVEESKKVKKETHKKQGFKKEPEEQLKGTKSLKDNKTFATKESISTVSSLVKVNVNRLDTSSHILKVSGTNSKDNRSRILLPDNEPKFSSVKVTKLK